MKPKTSESFQKIGLSPIVIISERAKDLAPAYEQKTGKQFIYFQRGEVGFDTPKYVTQAISDAAIVQKLTKYPKSGGEPWFKDAVITHLKDNSIENLKRDNIIATYGGQEGLQLTFNLFQNSKVAAFSPIWSCMLENIFPYSNCQPRFVPFKEQDEQLQINISELEKALKETDILYLNNPHNPTGKVFTPEELQTINEICKKQETLIVSDEAYKDITFDGKKHKSMLEFENDNVVAVFTGSKTFAITGLRIGYTVSKNKEIINHMTRGEYTQSAGVLPITQYALKTAIENKTEMKKWTDFFVNELQQRRNIIHDSLKQTFPNCYKAEGAFYFFINLNQYIPSTTTNKDEYLLEKLLQNGIAVVPGASFGPEWQGYARLSFSTLKQEQVQEGIERLKETVQRF